MHSSSDPGDSCRPSLDHDIHGAAFEVDLGRPHRESCIREPIALMRQILVANPQLMGRGTHTQKGAGSYAVVPLARGRGTIMFLPSIMSPRPGLAVARAQGGGDANEDPSPKAIFGDGYTDCFREL